MDLFDGDFPNETAKFLNGLVGKQGHPYASSIKLAEAIRDLLPRKSASAKTISETISRLRGTSASITDKREDIKDAIKQLYLIHFEPGGDDRTQNIFSILLGIHKLLPRQRLDKHFTP